jgi:hypothetical protein
VHFFVDKTAPPIDHAFYGDRENGMFIPFYEDNDASGRSCIITVKQAREA